MKKRIVTIGAATLVSLNMVGCATTQPTDSTQETTNTQPQIEQELSANEAFEQANGETFESRFMEIMGEVNSKLKTNMDTIQTSMNTFIASGDKQDFQSLYSKTLTFNQEAKDTKEELIKIENTIETEGFELDSQHKAILTLLQENMDNVISFTDTFERGMSTNNKDDILNCGKAMSQINNSVDFLEIMIDDFKKEISLK